MGVHLDGKQHSTIASTMGQVVSCSVMNAQLPFLYMGQANYGQAGFVLSSAAVKRALLCSYPWDSWTMLLDCPFNWRLSDTCVPGCPSEANQGLVPRVSRALTELQCSEDPRRCTTPAGGSSPVLGLRIFSALVLSIWRRLWPEKRGSGLLQGTPRLRWSGHA